MKFHQKLFEMLNIFYKIDDEKNITKEVKRLSLSLTQQKRILLYAQAKGFIKGDFDLEKNQLRINITPLGMDALYEYLERKSQKEFNRIIALTGSVLALMGIHGFLKILLEKNLGELIWLNIIIFLLIILCFIPIINFVVRSYMDWD